MNRITNLVYTMGVFCLHGRINLVLVLSCVIGVQCQRSFNPQLEGLQTSCGNGSALSNLDRYGGNCGNTFYSWYEETAYPYSYYYGGLRFVNGWGDQPLQYENTTELWDSICRWGDSLRICLRNILPHCSDDIGTELMNNPAAAEYIGRNREVSSKSDTLLAFYRKTCQGSTVKPGIKTLIDNRDFDKNVSCLNASHHSDLNRCLQPMYEELREAPRFGNAFTGFWRHAINRMAAGSLSCMYSIINSSPCKDVTKKVMYQVARLQIPSIIDISDLNVTETTTSDFTSVLRCTVGVYGDPHLRLCWQERLVTCSAPGNQVYLSNDFFSISAVNVAIGRRNNPPATSVRSIKITFKAISDSSIIGVYSGVNGALPEVFDNSNSSTIGQGDDKVSLRSDRYNRRLLVQHSTGMVLVLRKWSTNYFFTLRAAESLIHSSFGLLSTGCPRSQTIRLGRFVGGGRPATRRRRAVTEEQCGLACNATTDLPEFRESCLFDCYVTENITFAVDMTTEASEDVIEIITKDEEIRAEALTITTVASTTKKPSSSAARSFSSYCLPSLVVLTALVFRF